MRMKRREMGGNNDSESDRKNEETGKDESPMWKAKTPVCDALTTHGFFGVHDVHGLSMHYP